MKSLGTHLILDLWGAKNITETSDVSNILINCVNEIGATLLKIDIHQFNNGGVSGVALLAESHISIHTWPENNNYVAIDVFVCSTMDPYKIIPILEKEFSPSNIQISKIERGIIL